MDDEVRALAASQHAAVGRWQLRMLGLSRDWVRHRVRKGEWSIATPRVVVRSGSPATPEQRAMVAVLHEGPGAVASHRTAAWLWQLPGFDLEELDVVRAGRPGAGGRGAAHQPRLWLPHHMTEVRGVPCTSLPVTIFQLAALHLPHRRMVRLVHTVVGRSPLVLLALHRTLDELAERGRDGITEMREILADLPIGSRPAGSGTELRFEELLTESGEPPLHRQVDLGGHEWLGRVDYWDPMTRLVVEIQSDAYHSTPSDLASDARREAELLAAGASLVLFVWDDQIWRRPWEVAPAVREARRRAAALLVDQTGSGRPDLSTRTARRAS